MIDVFANQTGVVVTPGDRVTIGLDPRIARLSATGSTTAATGSIDRSFGQVSLFEHN
jgi:hypothetical protein